MEHTYNFLQLQLVQADEVNSFLEKNYNPDMSLEDAAALAIASVNLKAEAKDCLLYTSQSPRD